jgi:hypothetical protein
MPTLFCLGIQPNCLNVHSRSTSGLPRTTNSRGFVSEHETVRFFFLPVVPFHCRDGAIRFLKLASLTVIRADNRQLMVLFETRGL